MTRHHRTFAVAGLVACLGTLAACGGGGSPSQPAANGGQADPPTAAAAPSDVPTTEPGTGTSTPKNRARIKSLSGKVIVIDPGHNGGNAAHPEIINKQVYVITGRKACDTTGTASASGYSEHAFTWDVSNRLARLLRQQGAKVILTRSNDTGTGPCVTERAAIGNRANADAALSVHADGAGAKDHGFHIIEPLPLKGHNDKIVPASRRLGLAIRDAYHSGTGVAYSNYLGENAIDARDDLGGLNLSKVPKVFIECGNMRNSGDIAKLSSAAFRQKIAESLTDGFIEYFK